MNALRRRWKLAVVIAVAFFAGAVFFFPILPALAGASLLGIGAALLLEALDRTVKSSADVHRKLGLEVFGALPRFAGSVGSAGHPERQLLNGLPPDNPSVQALCDLCRRIEAALVTAVRPVIMVTSCIPGEGKSTVSANLAVALGHTGKKVLLVGCDLRRPTLGGIFGEPEQPGLTELLERGDQSALRRLTAPPIDLIPGGNIPRYPAELLGSKAMRDFLEYARDRYDYVVIDAPPVLPVTDAQLLAPLCDLRLAVVEPCRTQVAMLRQLLESLRSVGQGLDGVVMNDKSGRAARYYESGSAAAGPGRGAASPRQWGYLYAAIVALVTAAIGGYLWLALPGGDQLPSSRKPSVATIPAGSGDRPVEQPLPVKVETAVVKPAEPSTPVPATVLKPTPPEAPRVLPAPPPAVAVKQVATEARLVEPVAVAGEIPEGASPAGLKSAVKALAGAWRKPLPGGPTAGSAEPQGWITAMGLQGSPFTAELPTHLKLGTPLLLEVHTDNGPSWVAVVGRKGYRWQVSPPADGNELLTEAELAGIWTGKGCLPWHDPLRLAALDADRPAPELVKRLQQLLVSAGALQQFELGVYDRETIKSIGQLQATNGQRVNGQLTPETLVLLYQADPAFAVPKFAMWP